MLLKNRFHNLFGCNVYTTSFDDKSILLCCYYCMLYQNYDSRSFYELWWERAFQGASGKRVPFENSGDHIVGTKQNFDLLEINLRLP